MWGIGEMAGRGLRRGRHVGDVACWVGQVDEHVYRFRRWGGPTFSVNDENLDLGRWISFARISTLF